MTGSPCRIGMLILATALAKGGHTGASQSGGANTQSDPKAPVSGKDIPAKPEQPSDNSKRRKTLPYAVESQPARQAPKQVAPSGKASPSSPSTEDPNKAVAASSAGNPLSPKSDSLGTPQGGSAQHGVNTEKLYQPQWKQHKDQSGKETEPHNDEDRSKFALDKTTLPPVPKSDFNSILLISLVGGGSLMGLLGSWFILRCRFSKTLSSRPYGDVARSNPFSKVRPEQLWEAAGPDKSDFQLQNALRHNLISDREFRELRSKYLIAGNFSFSMLLPLLMMVVLFTAGLSLRLVFLVPVAAAAFTMLLTTYAVDRRHQFRSEFRAVIVQRWEENNKPGARPAQKQNDTEPPPPAASSSSSTTFSSSSAAAGQDPDDPNMRGLA